MGASNYPATQIVLDENGEPTEVVQGTDGKTLVQDEELKGLLLAILGKLESIENNLLKIND